MQACHIHSITVGFFFYMVIMIWQSKSNIGLVQIHGWHRACGLPAGAQCTWCNDRPSRRAQQMHRSKEDRLVIQHRQEYQKSWLMMLLCGPILFFYLYQKEHLCFLGLSPVLHGFVQTFGDGGEVGMVVEVARGLFGLTCEVRGERLAGASCRSSRCCSCRPVFGTVVGHVGLVDVVGDVDALQSKVLSLCLISLKKTLCRRSKRR